jgi:hypothetical protein
MSSEPAAPKKQWYEILSVLTPLIVGIFVTFSGIVITNEFNQKQLQINSANNVTKLKIDDINTKRQLKLNEVTLLDKFHAKLISKDDDDRTYAYAMFDYLGHTELAIKIGAGRNDTALRPVLENVIAASDKEYSKLSKDLLTSIPAKIYLHIGNKSQHDQASKIEAALKDQKFLVQGIENLNGKATMPNITDVRYFNAEDLAAAESIKKILEENGIIEVKLNKLNKVKRYKVRPGSLEIWFADDVK